METLKITIITQENVEEVDNIITGIRTALPLIKIFVWTGYTLEELKKQNNTHINNILQTINVLIDGKFI